MYHLHTCCRACGYGGESAPGTKSGSANKLVPVFDLGLQPLANDFAPQGAEQSGYAPLAVLFCPQCSLAQLSVVVNPETLYRNYRYVTSPSQMMRDHFATLIQDLKLLTSGRSVLEIGSNDGTLLETMRNADYVVEGVDPAANLAILADRKGINTHVGLFGSAMARDLPAYDIVIARHVFCHVNDWRDFVSGLEGVTHFQSIVAIEAPYVGDLLSKCEFDTIYHEHLSYLSIKAVNALLKDSKFYLARVIHYPIHGGAMLLILQRKEVGINPVESVANAQDNFTVPSWLHFSSLAHKKIHELKDLVADLRCKNHRIASLGASAKSTVWISACGFMRKEIAFIADSTPQKQYTFSPGTDIPIADEGAILRDLPDYVIMWAWNYREELLDKFDLARKKGVKFIVPTPSLEII